MGNGNVRDRHPPEPSPLVWQEPQGLEQQGPRVQLCGSGVKKGYERTYANGTRARRNGVMCQVTRGHRDVRGPGRGIQGLRRRIRCRRRHVTNWLGHETSGPENTRLNDSRMNHTGIPGGGAGCMKI